MLAVYEKYRKVIELRAAGFHFYEIAPIVGYADATGAYRAAQAYLKLDAHESTREYKALNLSRLNETRKAYWNDLQPKNEDRYRAVNAELRVQERESALLGLDAPKPAAVVQATNIQIVVRYERAAEKHP